jgi:hypothetical protein
MLGKAQRQAVRNQVAEMLNKLPYATDEENTGALNAAHLVLKDITLNALTTEQSSMVLNAKPASDGQALLSDGSSYDDVVTRLCHVFTNPGLLVSLPDPTAKTAKITCAQSRRLSDEGYIRAMIQYMAAFKLHQLRQEAVDQPIAGMDANQTQRLLAQTEKQFKQEAAKSHGWAGSFALLALSLGVVAAPVSAYFCEDNRCETSNVTEGFEDMVNWIADAFQEPAARIAATAVAGVASAGLACNLFRQATKPSGETAVSEAMLSAPGKK